MAYSKQKNPSIQWIFQKSTDVSDKDAKIDKRASYSKSALLYQQISSYAIELNSDIPANGIYESFTVWQLAGWLIDNYYEYKNEMKEYPYKNMSRNNRIEAKLEGVKSKVQSLKILDLIEEKGLIKASRGDENTMSLSFTSSGYLLAWIIEGLLDEKRQASNIQIWNVLEYNYRDRPSSFDFFAFRLTEKFKEQGLFDELVGDVLRDRATDPQWNINTVLELIYSLSIPDRRKVKFFYELWIQTLNELDVSQRSIVMQYIKLNLGRIIEERLEYIRGYEELRYDLRDNPAMLAVEGKCNNCNHPSPVAFNLLEYIQIEELPYAVNGIICPRCGYSNTVSILSPTF
jgi:hypothetical protein